MINYIIILRFSFSNSALFVTVVRGVQKGLQEAQYIRRQQFRLCEHVLANRDQGYSASRRQERGTFVQSEPAVGSGGIGRGLAGQADDDRYNQRHKLFVE